MKKIFLFFILICVCFAFSGCNTITGAANGAYKDWQVLKRADKKFQKKYW